MITLEDCRGLCDADPALVARLARDEALPEVLALARAQQLCHGANKDFPRAAWIHTQPAGDYRLAA